MNELITIKLDKIIALCIRDEKMKKKENEDKSTDEKSYASVKDKEGDEDANELSIESYNRSNFDQNLLSEESNWCEDYSNSEKVAILHDRVESLKC